MEELIIEILKKIGLDKEYKKLCLKYSDFDNRANLNKKEVEPIIKSHDSDFKYIARDKTFLKEIAFEEYTVRFFIGYQGGIVDFAYLIWKEGDNDNFYQGRLASLTELMDSRFEDNVNYQTPIATSLDDFKEILSKIFELFEQFKQHFDESLEK